MKVLFNQVFLLYSAAQIKSFIGSPFFASAWKNECSILRRYHYIAFKVWSNRKNCSLVLNILIGMKTTASLSRPRICRIRRVTFDLCLYDVCKCLQCNAAAQQCMIFVRYLALWQSCESPVQVAKLYSYVVLLCFQFIQVYSEGIYRKHAAKASASYRKITRESDEKKIAKQFSFVSQVL